jgi:hypothetical protein
MGTPLTSVSGIGPAAAAVLAEHGFASAEQLAASVIEDLVKVPGFGPVRAATTLRAARTLIEGRDAKTAAPAGGKSAKPGKGKKNKQSKKKPKGKDKKKESKKDQKKSKKTAAKKRKDGKSKKRGKRKKK